jgi:hypothetical protein
MLTDKRDAAEVIEAVVAAAPKKDVGIFLKMVGVAIFLVGLGIAISVIMRGTVSLESAKDKKPAGAVEQTINGLAPGQTVTKTIGGKE